ncbi:MAG: hypothetical protein BGO82_12405 [Devosia sp. 67-54]|uniref:SH3 domain-containing protein n=1 Tax=unclassified Devosia TaxID=196773 RepID=UPI00095D5D5F|nr:MULTISPECIES: SH3 domain-containing protein [unclassified Devosia]MBN9304553.1 SH3 domain-containing protein [Devosia sp.]OJX15451.1 MAG: hypothetical protein BGO82_12405 [Devosia sp. 67-54]
MGNSLASQIGGNLIVRASLLTVLIVGFLGVASGVIPVGCLMTGSCKPPATPAETAVAKLQPPAPAGTEGKVQMVKPVVQKATPSLSHNDVLAATFAQLKVDLQPPTATTTPNSSTTTVATATPPQGVPGGSKINPDSGLTTRMVRAVTVNPDGTPNLSGMAEAYAEPSRLIAPRSPAVEAAARIGAGQMPVIEAQAVAELKPAKASDAAAAPAGTGNATVLGAGANVRVSPGKGGRVLFALNGGERVTVVESKRGWLKIKDDQGRTGWIFSDGVKRG